MSALKEIKNARVQNNHLVDVKQFFFWSWLSVYKSFECIRPIQVCCHRLIQF